MSVIVNLSKEISPVTRQRLGAAILGLGLAIIAGILVPNLNVLDWNLYELLAIMGVFILCLVPLFLSFQAGKLDLFEPVYMISFATLTSFVFVPVWLLLTGSGHIYDTGVDYRPEAATAVALSGIGLFGFYVGYYMFLSQSRKPRILQELNRSQTREIICKVAWIGLFLSVTLFMLWLQTSRVSLWTLNALGEESYYRYAIKNSQSSVLYLYTAHVAWTGLLLLIYAYSSSKGSRVMIAVIWSVILILYLMGGSRGIVLRLIVSTAVYYYLAQAKRPRLTTVATFIVGFALVAGCLVVLRSRQYENESATDLSVVTTAIEHDLTSGGAATGTMVLVQVFPERNDFLYWGIFEELLYAPIPRVIWPDKPRIRAVLNITEQYVARAHAPAFFGPYYAGFGLVGVVTSMIVLGIFSAWIYTLWADTPTVPLTQVLLALWVGFLWELYHRGGMTWLLVNFSYYLGPVFLITILARLTINSSKKRSKSACLV